MWKRAAPRKMPGSTRRVWLPDPARIEPMMPPLCAAPTPPKSDGENERRALKIACWMIICAICRRKSAAN